MLQRLRSSLVDALRALVSTPVTTFVTVLLLAVAVGANLAVFGLIDRAILTPARAVVRPDRLFTLAFAVPGDAARSGPGMTTTSYVTYDTLRTHVSGLEQLAAWRRTSATAIVSGEQLRAETMLVTASYFAALGARPGLGRTLLPDDDSPSGQSAVISHAFWRSAFASDPEVIGRRVMVNRIDYAVAGVMPSGFSGHSATRVDIWLPMSAAMRDVPGWNLTAFRNVVSLIARVAPGSDVAAAEQASVALARRVTLVAISGGEVASTERRIAWALAAVSLLVLVVGLANAATLLLVRGTRRRRELAIRTALGATRGRLLTQVLLEAAMLACLAVAGALAMASWFGDGVRQVLLAGIVDTSGLGSRTVFVALAAGFCTMAIAATAGLLQLPRQVRATDLSGACHNRYRSRAYTALLLVQTTLSVVLIAGAAMFGRSLYNLMAQDFGMRLDGVVLVGFERGPGIVADAQSVFTSALERIRAMPGVAAATTIQSMPFAGFHVPPIGVPGRAESPNVNGQLPFLIAATPELFTILGIDIVEGRSLSADDDRGAPVVVVNETMARTVWPGESALGKCIRIGFDPNFDPFSAAGPPGPPTMVPCREVVGVARDVRQRSVVPGGSEDRLMQYFVPQAQVPGPPAGVGPGPGVQGLLVRANMDVDALVAPIRRAVLNGRTDLPFVEVRAYADLLQQQMRPWRLGTTLLTLFGVLALGVAGTGLYAVFAHAIAERRQEMAIRIAIGAHPRRVLAMILAESGRVAALGVLSGCVLAVVAGRGLQSMLVGIAPSDPLVLGLAAVVMLAVAVAATLLPARAAARADPTSLLRAE